ncbi:MAG: hypothetical protein WDW36_003024 [Sanguina aurantia]
MARSSNRLGNLMPVAAQLAGGAGGDEVGGVGAAEAHPASRRQEQLRHHWPSSLNLLSGQPQRQHQRVDGCSSVPQSAASRVSSSHQQCSLIGEHMSDSAQFELRVPSAAA